MSQQPPTADGQPAEYRIEELAHLSGATVRTIRAYQDRGLLPRPERRGRANVYGDAHLARLRQIADLLDRGYTLASIKELLEAWDAGLDLGGVLGLVAEIDGPWTDEKASRISRADLDTAFGGTSDEAAVAEAVALGVLERIPGHDHEFLVPSPQELAVAAELHSAGVPLLAISGHLREVRGQVEHIAARFVDFTTEHIFRPFLDHPPTDSEAAEAAALVRRLRPLAQQTIDAELARAMRTLATRSLRRHLAESLPGESREADAEASAPGPAPTAAGPAPGAGDVLERVAGAGAASVPEPGHGGASLTEPGHGCASGPAHASGAGRASVSGRISGLGRANPTPGAAPVPESGAAPGPVADPRPATGPEPVALPADIVQAVRDLVGPENTAAFIAAAAHREVHARTMDALAASGVRDAAAGDGAPRH
ncbi:MerR family transcriptional regulator [Streptomyces chattanoogensis]|uniref:MerR family transcriptional regulator n=1 Tax=Streptomyces chattanoogensis TaxID=66876 RepID=UPI0036945E7A